MLKGRRVGWARYVARTGQKRKVYRILKGKREGQGGNCGRVDYQNALNLVKLRCWFNPSDSETKDFHKYCLQFFRFSARYYQHLSVFSTGNETFK